MRVDISKENTKEGCQYTLVDNSTWEGLLYETKIYEPLAKIVVKENVLGITYELQEEFSIKKIVDLMFVVVLLQAVFRGEMDHLSIILILINAVLCYLFSSVYKYYRNGVCIGKTIVSMNPFKSSSFFIDGHCYRVKGHSNYKKSIMQDEQQVALLVTENRNLFELFYEKRVKEQMDILFALSILNGPKKHRSGTMGMMSGNAVSKVLFDSEKDNVNWRPTE